MRWRYGSASTEYIPPRKDRPVTFALPAVTSARDAADLMAAVTKAVATGNITPSEATEIAKVIDAYVKAYQTAELDERVALVHQLSDAELMRIASTARSPLLIEGEVNPDLGTELGTERKTRVG